MFESKPLIGMIHLPDLLVGGGVIWELVLSGKSLTDLDIYKNGFQ